MSEPKHSPLPWAYEWPGDIVDAKGHFVGDLEHRANSELVVLAVNSFGPLVEALEKVADLCSRGNPNCDPDEAREVAEEALEKARSGT